MAYGPVNIPGVNETAKGMPNGVASLDASGKVPADQLPPMNYDPAGSAANVQANLATHINDKNNPHGITAEKVGAVPTSSKGIANGVASLDASGKVPSAQLPVLGGHTAQATAPGNTNFLWIDTANGNILKFYDASSKTWKPVGAVWS